MQNKHYRMMEFPSKKDNLLVQEREKTLTNERGPGGLHCHHLFHEILPTILRQNLVGQRYHNIFGLQHIQFPGGNFYK